MKQHITSQYTKQLLADSLKLLLQKKPFSKISVSEIVNDCQLNRKTFYYHFTDIYDLLEYLVQQDLLDQLQLLPGLHDFEDFKASFRLSLKCLEQSSYLSSCADDFLAYDRLVQFFQKKFEPILIDLLSQLEQTYGTSLEAGYRNFLVTTFARTSGLVLMDQIKNHTYADPDELISYLDAFYFSFDGIFSNMLTPNPLL
uniref:TetR family transcriptional regulator n=1 Tax=Agathobacter sp. TaxID=2021311 RepID=UPI00405766E2